jgi:soluble lytic murein transglycosylase-like protein
MIFSTSTNDLLKVIKTRADITPRNEELLITILPYIQQIDIDPLLVLAVMEQESTYRWVHGDSGKAIGFMQLHLGTAQFIIHIYKDYLFQLGIKNLDVQTEHDLVITPVRTTILATLWLYHNIKYTDNIYTAISRYNGINNDDYVKKVFQRYYEIVNIYERVVH